MSDENGQSEGQGGAINKQIDFSAQMEVFRAQFSARDRRGASQEHSLPQAGLANRSLELPEHTSFTDLPSKGEPDERRARNK